MLTSLLAGLTVWYLDRIPTKLLTNAREVLAHRPWLQPMLSMNGRELVLSGNLEPTGKLNQDIESLTTISGIRSVSNRLETVHRLAPKLLLDRRKSEILLHGYLTDEDLDQVLGHVRAVFPKASVRDDIRIDGHRGHPLWLTKLTSILDELSTLENFTIIGNRDQVRVEGTVHDASQMGTIHQRVPVGLDPAVTVSFRLWPTPDPTRSTLSLISDTNGTTLNLQTDDGEFADHLYQAMVQERAFGKNIEFNLILDSQSQTPTWFNQIFGILPFLGLAHDLRLVSGGQSLWLWGRVHDADIERRLEAALKVHGLEGHINTSLEVHPAGNPVELSLFRDRQGVILRGRLPNSASKSQLLSLIKTDLHTRHLKPLITLDPDIAFNPWSIQWNNLYPLLPETPFGLTITDDSVLITGQAATNKAHDALIDAIKAMLPGITLINWLTLSTDKHDLSSG